MTTTRQLWNDATCTTAAATSTDDMPTMPELLEIVERGQAMMDDYRRDRDESFAKIRCGKCGRGVKAIDRGMGEEWAVCSHILKALKQQYPLPVGEPRSAISTLSAVRIVPWELALDYI